MSSSPLQFVNARTYPHPPIARLLRRCHKRRRPICAPMGQQGPGHARHLVGKCHRHDLEGSSRQEPREPGIFLRVLHGAPQDGMRADDENASQIAVALLGDRPELLLAPVESCRGTSPIQAAKSRPDRNTVGSATVAAIAVAPMTPMPGMVSTRWLASFERCCILIRFSIARSPSAWPQAAPPI